MLYYFLYDTSDDALKYAIYSEDRTESVSWCTWKDNKYKTDCSRKKISFTVT